MLSIPPIIAAALFSAFHVAALPSARGWNIKNLKSVVTFGDSYTDEQRLSYFADHNGTAPPPGWVQPVVSSLSV
jgi:hypothetical protein